MLNEQTATLPPDTLTAPGDLSVVEAESSETNDQLRQLQMLSQSPLSLEEALEQEAAVAVEVEEVPATATGLMLRFAAQLALFVGVGLIAASVVHHASDPKLYALLALGGGVLFASGSVASAKQATQDGIIAAVIYGAASLFLGLGVGLLVGGLLHYSAAPHQSTVTIPLGLVVAIAALFARDGRGLIGKEVVPTAITIVGLLVWLSIGLGVGAKKLDPPATPGTPAAGQAAPTDGHGAATADEHGAASTGDHGAATTGAKAAA
ncbi:MAG: hypothetical protein Q7T55_19050, partial [Solirubrobacteraceae bacterium]|nr:hypothetical protein [Solirubrobacteraceae bacterium]